MTIQQISKNSITQGMAKLLGISSLITGFDNDGLSAGVSAVQDNNNLSSLDAKIQKHKNKDIRQSLTQVERH